MGLFSQPTHAHYPIQSESPLITDSVINLEWEGKCPPTRSTPTKSIHTKSILTKSTPTKSTPTRSTSHKMNKSTPTKLTSTKSTSHEINSHHINFSWGQLNFIRLDLISEKLSFWKVDLLGSWSGKLISWEVDLLESWPSGKLIFWEVDMVGVDLVGLNWGKDNWNWLNPFSCAA